MIEFLNYLEINQITSTMKNKNVFFVIPALLLLSFTIVKTIPLDKVIKNLEYYNTEAYPDKVYLHTDRAVYAQEDTIWMKSYLVNGITHQPDSESKVIHIDLVNSQNKKVVDSQLAYVNNAGSANDIIIDRSWEPGNYTIRAYTQYMLNEDPEYLFTKDIKILDINTEYEKYAAEYATEKTEQVAPEKFTGLELSFYPQGGDMIAGLENKVGLKLKGLSDTETKLSGQVFDEKGNAVAEFRVYKFGLGSVAFTPEKGEKYYAKLNIDGVNQKFKLPSPKNSGVVINVINKFESANVIINSTEAISLNGGKLIGHTRGKMFIEKTIPDEVTNEYSISINTSELLSGIASFTFFNKEGMPECERLIFVDNKNIDVDIATGKDIYNKREKLDIQLTEKSGIVDPDQSYDCSVSVVELANLNISDSQQNIKTWLLLNSDLRGEIESPTYFFEKYKDSKRFYILDLVMLTNGWRRFTWKEMNKPRLFSKYKHERENGLYIEGKTVKMLNSNSGVKTNVTLTFMDNSLYEEEMTSDNDGYFKFGPFAAYDSIPAFIQARRHKSDKNREKLDGKRNVNIQLIDNKPMVDFLRKPKTEKSIKDYESYTKYLTNSKTAQVLKDQYSLMSVELDELVITAKKRKEDKKLDDIQKRLTYYNEPTTRLTFENGENNRYFSIFDMLRSTSGVTVNGPTGQETVTIRGIASINANTDPLFLVNGIETPIDFIRVIQPSQVDFIDVIKDGTAAIFGLRGGNGVISIFTGNTNTTITDRRPGIVNFSLNGFYGGREFYSPDYSKEVSRVFTPDTRSTLYWNPLVSLTPGESKELSLYTGDITGQFEILVEGVGSDGSLIHQKHQFEVR